MAFDDLAIRLRFDFPLLDMTQKTVIGRNRCE